MACNSGAGDDKIPQRAATTMTALSQNNFMTDPLRDAIELNYIELNYSVKTGFGAIALLAGPQFSQRLTANHARHAPRVVTHGWLFFHPRFPAA